MNTLSKILTSRVRAEIFRLLFGLLEKELHLREMERRSGLSAETIRRDLKKLIKLDLVKARQDGNRLYYHANKEHPIYPQIHLLVLKTAGLVEVLQKVLERGEIKMAFIFGSVASGTESGASDIDLMVVGDIGLRKLTGLLAGVSQEIGREINPHVMRPEEFSRRLKKQDHFLSQVLASPKLFIIGREDDLTAMGG